MDSTVVGYNIVAGVSLVIALAAIVLCGVCVAYAFSHRQSSENRPWSAHCIIYILILVLCALDMVGACWCVIADICGEYGGLESPSTYSQRPPRRSYLPSVHRFGSRWRVHADLSVPRV